MTRKEFLKLTGMTAGAYALTRCLGACSSTPQAYPTPPSNVNITINTWVSPYTDLLNNGGYVYVQGIIVATVKPGEYLAVSEYCTHQGTAVVYQPAYNDFFCSAHSATFAYTGAVVSGPATVALQQYSVTPKFTINGWQILVTG